MRSSLRRWALSRSRSEVIHGLKRGREVVLVIEEHVDRVENGGCRRKRRVIQLGL